MIFTWLAVSSPDPISLCLCCSVVAGRAASGQLVQQKRINQEMAQGSTECNSSVAVQQMQERVAAH